MNHFIIDDMLHEDKLKEISVKVVWGKIQKKMNFMFIFCSRTTNLKYFFPEVTHNLEAIQ